MSTEKHDDSSATATAQLTNSHSLNAVDQTSKVELQQVCFGYGSRRILNNIDLHIPRGKVVAILGGERLWKNNHIAFNRKST